jgi:D-3-phosphoglycerate dehydrogenase
MFKILIADSIAKPGLEELKKNPNFEVVEKTKITPEELTAEIGDYNALVVRSRTKVTAEMIEKAKNMKLIVRGGVGTDNIDKKAAEKMGIAVKNTPKASSISVAELVIGMMLAGVRELVDATVSTKNGKWEKKRFEGIEIYDKTIGIVGYGNIGKEIAKRAIGMGMKVLAYDPFVTSTDIHGVKLTTLDEVIKSSDFVTLNCPKTEETKGLINEKSIETMKDGVGIINCSRGGIIDEAALKAAIEKGKVSFAGIDVYGTEPPDVSHPFFAMEKVILTPHVGAQTKEGQTRVAVEVASVINDFFK